MPTIPIVKQQDDPLGAWKVNEEHHAVQEAQRDVIHRETLAEKLEKAKEARLSLSVAYKSHDQQKGSLFTDEDDGTVHSKSQVVVDKQEREKTEKETEREEEEGDEDSNVRATNVQKQDLFSHLKTTSSTTVTTTTGTTGLFDDELLDGFLEEDESIRRSFETLNVGDGKIRPFDDWNEDVSANDLFKPKGHELNIGHEFDFASYIAQQQSQSSKSKGLFDE